MSVQIFKTSQTKLDDFLHPKTFVMSLSALTLLLVLSLGLSAVFMDGAPKQEMTGKAMATLQLHAPAPEPEPEIKTPEPDLPVPTAETPSHDQLTQDLEAKPLESTDKPPSEENAVAPTESPMDIEDSMDGLTEDSPEGTLPIIRQKDGLKSLDAYKAPFKPLPDTKSVITLTMVDYGLSDKISKEALEKLPPATTFIASPYATNLQAKITVARSKRNEVWLNIPSQSPNFAQNDTGPASLLSGINSKQNINRLNTNLGRATGYAGVAFANTPDFPAMSPELQSVIDAITSRGLGLAQMDTTDKTISSFASQSKAPFIQNTIWIDTSLTKNDILKTLSSLETLSLEKGYVVAAFHPSPLVIDAIATWQKSLKEKNIQLAPLSYALHQSTLVPITPAPKSEPAHK